MNFIQSNILLSNDLCKKGMIVEAFGRYSYMAVGIIETVKGLLAFVSSPLFGKLSDKIGNHLNKSLSIYQTIYLSTLLGRKYCILSTVIGTTLPVVLMVIYKHFITCF